MHVVIMEWENAKSVYIQQNYDLKCLKLMSAR